MSLKLTYFPVRGLGEQLRLLMIDQGIEFTDDRFNRDNWSEMKSTMLFGQVPVLYVGDVAIFQTGAIIRYLARKAGVYGENELDAARIDMIYEGICDMRKSYTSVVYTDFEGGRDKLISTTLPAQLTIFEKVLKEEGGGKAYLTASKISFADYSLFDILDNFLILSPTILDNFPTLKAFHGRLQCLPNLQTYLKSDMRKNTKLNGNGKQ